MANSYIRHIKTDTQTNIDEKVYDNGDGTYSPMVYVNGGVSTPAALGQGTMAQSMPVVIASNQATFPVTATNVATEVHLGEVGGNSLPVFVTPTVSAAAIYAAGDAVGGKQTLTSAMRISSGKGLLQSIQIIDLDNQKAPLDIYFFNADPSLTTITDNAKPSVNATDKLRIVGVVSVAAADYVTMDDGGTDFAIAMKVNVGLVIRASGSANLFAMVVTSGTPTYTTTSSLVFNYGFMRD